MPVVETPREARKRRCRESARRSWLKRKLYGRQEPSEQKQLRLSKERKAKNAWAQANPEKIRASYRNHKAKRLLYAKKRYEADPASHRESARAYYHANREQVLARKKAHGRKNPEHINAVKRAWWKRTKPQREARLAISRPARTPEYKAKMLERARSYRKRHPGCMTAATQLRRARKAASTIKAAQIKEWITRFKSLPVVRCYYCDALVPAAAVQVDHVVALARGGEHSITNCCAACGSCNLQKHAKHISEWWREGQQILPL